MPIQRLQTALQSLRSSQGSSQLSNLGTSALVHGVVVASLVLALQVDGGEGESPGPDAFEATFSAALPPLTPELETPRLIDLTIDEPVDIDWQLTPFDLDAASPSQPPPRPLVASESIGNDLRLIESPTREFRSLGAARTSNTDAPATDRARVASAPKTRPSIGPLGSTPDGDRAAPVTPVIARRKSSPPAPVAGACPPPVYPRSAKRRKLTGTVTLEVDVAVNGSVTAVRIAESSGHDILDRAAANAVEDWRFTPATENGKRRAVTVRKPIEFNLGGA